MFLKGVLLGIVVGSRGFKWEWLGLVFIFYNFLGYCFFLVKVGFGDRRVIF